MNLPSAPHAYDQTDQAQVRAALQRADAESFKKGRDVILTQGQRLVLVDEATGSLYRLKVASGVLSLVAYP